MKQEILKILEEASKGQTNLASEVARKSITNDILQIIEYSRDSWATDTDTEKTNIQILFEEDTTKQYVKLPTEILPGDWNKGDLVEWEQSIVCTDEREYEGLVLINLTNEKRSLSI